MKFEELGLDETILYGLQDMGFKEPTPVQEQAIPIILEGKDVIACAQTGTGKTAAFLLPLMSEIQRTPEIYIKCLILCPTRELARQIDEQAEGFSYHSDVTSVAVYGGNKKNDWAIQRKALEEGADIIIATPGRLQQHLSLGYVDLSRIEYLVLDEADRMLDMGFLGDIQRIVSYIPESRQTLLFSATMPGKIRQLAKEILNNPKEISIAISKPAEGINQRAFMVHESQKLDLLIHLIDSMKDIQSMIIFASRKSDVDQIERSLKRKGYPILGMHSDRDQSERESIMHKFASGEVKMIVATDILSRGIDITGISHVINYNVPPDPEDYVHRIGRTARADSTGEAVTFISGDDFHRFKRIEKLIEKDLIKEELPEGFRDAPEYSASAGSGGGRGYGGRGGGGRGGSGRGGGGRGGSGRGGGGRGGSGRGGGGRGGSGRGGGGRGGSNRGGGGGNQGGGGNRGGGGNSGGGGGNRGGGGGSNSGGGNRGNRGGGGGNRGGNAGGGNRGGGQ